MKLSFVSFDFCVVVVSMNLKPNAVTERILQGGQLYTIIELK